MLRVVDDGSRFELRNESRTRSTVLGYDASPYLRVGPAGVRNGAFSRRVLEPPSGADEHTPAPYNATSPPQWHRISDANVVRRH